ncbi:MAG: hypothetical protein GC154_20135 [bacterium]|nr:hypothetical protein [bacterium]
MASIGFMGIVGLCAQSQPLGLFTDHCDVGAVKHAGGVSYDKAAQTYAVTGGGENMWFTEDALHYVWTRRSGDFSLAADVAFKGEGGNAHRKACLIIRQDLTPGSAYADVALHGDGLTSLQYREAPGGMTREIQSNATAPTRLMIERRGEYVFMSVQPEGGEMQPAGGSFRITLSDPVYVGLGVCAHDNNASETAVFSNVELTALPPMPENPTRLESTLEVIDVASKDRRVVYRTEDHIEAPNWSRDGSYFIFNSGGKLYTLPVEGGEPTLLDTGFANRCNNDHGISPDATTLAISDSSQNNASQIYTLPIGGGTPRLVTPKGPSYWHGWSPDGKTLAYCAERGGEFDVYSIPVDGGEETRLTTAEGLDDGPDYAPDGNYIYFNSVRTGTMQIWRMKPDGSEQKQLTTDEYNDWFAHPSPDGTKLVFVSFEPGVEGHPPNKDVMLRMMPAEGGEIETLAKLFGGQGTMNVPSWSPDGKKIAFVSYRLLP